VEERVEEEGEDIIEMETEEDIQEEKGGKWKGVIISSFNLKIKTSSIFLQKIVDEYVYKDAYKHAFKHAYKNDTLYVTSHY
jgi:hypothetical protein